MHVLKEETLVTENKYIVIRGSDNICRILTWSLSVSPEKFFVTGTSAVSSAKCVRKWETADMLFIIYSSRIRWPLKFALMCMLHFSYNPKSYLNYSMLIFGKSIHIRLSTQILPFTLFRVNEEKHIIQLTYREKTSIPEDCSTLLLSCSCTFSSSNRLFPCSVDAHLCNVKHGCIAMEPTAVVHISKKMFLPY